MKMKMTELYVIGAPDAEMSEIEKLLNEHDCQYMYAMKDGNRVNPRSAYEADTIDFSGYSGVVLIECKITDIPEDVVIEKIDHHNPGDSGYGLPASEYWQASSVGQLYSYLGIDDIPHDVLILAAMDHCPAAAILGLCPGVTAEEVIDRKIEELHKWLKVPCDLIKARMLESDTLIKSMSLEVIGGQEIRDLRALSYGASSDLNLRCAVLAALAGGYAILYRQEYNDKKEIGVQGHATPETIEAFMQEWGPANELTGIYGVPERGYAGGYLE